MATIRERQWTNAKGLLTKRWQVDFVDQGGRRRHKQFRLKKEADAYLVGARGAVAAGTYAPESTSPTIGEAIDAWIKRGEAERLERSTIVQRRQHKVHILAVIPADTRLAKISATRLETARDTLLTTHSRALARKVVVSLRTILRQAKAVHLATAEMKVKGAGRHRKRLEVGVDIPTPEEVKAVVTAAAGEALALLCLAAFAGLRASELRGLRWADLDLGSNSSPTVTVSQRADRWQEIGSPKSEAARRTIPLGETTARAVRAWKFAQAPITYRENGEKRQRPAALMFGTRTNRPDSLSNMRRKLLAPTLTMARVTLPVLDDAGKPVKDGQGRPVMKPKYGLHAFRHYAISAWLRTCDGDFKLVQIRAGHASLALTLDRYGHLLQTKGREQVADAERGLFG